jgi:hypothetical protein
MDLLGLLKTVLGQFKYLKVVVDYFAKLVEVEAALAIASRQLM